MIKNYLKIAIRSLTKHKQYSLINISGLALGMCCSLFIWLWIQDELNFDGFHQKKDRIHIVINHMENGLWSASPWALSPILKKDFPEIEKSTRVYGQKLLVKYEEERFYESIAFVDPDFLEMFSFPLEQGDLESALIDKQSVVISEKAALKYFPNQNPMGKNLQVDHELNLTVTGVVKKYPDNSSIGFDMLVPINNLGEDRLATWSYEAPAFVLVKENTNLDNLQAKISGTTKKYDARTDFNDVVVDLFPFSQLRLRGLYNNGTSQYVYIFSAIALLVLIIASINFINLVTAKASARPKEIGMRKVLGANKRHIIWHFFGETLILSLTAFLLALTIVKVLLPSFNSIADKQIRLDLYNPLLILGSASIIFITAFLSCSYPILKFTALRPVRVLKNAFSPQIKKIGTHWSLVVLQFSISITLIVVTITMARQIDFIQSKNLGFNRGQVISISLNNDSRNRYEVFKNELLQDPNVTHVTASSNSPNDISSNNPVYWEGGGPDQYTNMRYLVMDYDFLETFEIELVEGRTFTRDFRTDQENYIVNEAAVDLMKMNSPIGKLFSMWQAEGKIIGVVKDFNFSTLHNEVAPLVITMRRPIPLSQIFIRVKPEDVRGSLASIENTWNEILPEYPFQYEFLDESFHKQYESEDRLKSIFQYFSLLAILISCIGLFGLTAFTTQNRVKEIGIRKVNGAKIFEVLTLLNKDLVKWVAIAFVIATPIAFLFMNKWLENFAYKTELSWWIFALAGALAMMIALLTVSWQSWKAATRNPVEALRYE